MVNNIVRKEDLESIVNKVLERFGIDDKECKNYLMNVEIETIMLKDGIINKVYEEKQKGENLLSEAKYWSFRILHDGKIKAKKDFSQKYNIPEDIFKKYNRYIKLRAKLYITKILKNEHISEEEGKELLTLEEELSSYRNRLKIWSYAEVFSESYFDVEKRKLLEKVRNSIKNLERIMEMYCSSNIRGISMGEIVLIYLPHNINNVSQNIYIR